MITIHDVIQGTPEWHALREDKWTGSIAHYLLKRGNDLATLSKLNDSTFFGNFYTKRGHILEDEAIELYEAIRGVRVSRPGFITNSEYPNAGVSLDGLTDLAIIEVKAFNAEKHMAIWHGNIPLVVMAQLYFGGLIAERRLAHLVIHNPDIADPKFAFKIIEVKLKVSIMNNFRRLLKEEPTYARA